MAFLPMAMAAHSLEEANRLRAWSGQAGVWHYPIGAGWYHFAVAVLTLLDFGAVGTAAGEKST